MKSNNSELCNNSLESHFGGQYSRFVDASARGSTNNPPTHYDYRPAPSSGMQPSPGGAYVTQSLSGPASPNRNTRVPGQNFNNAPVPGPRKPRGKNWCRCDALIRILRYQMHRLIKSTFSGVFICHTITERI